MTTITETEPQHFQALREANRIRLARAAYKRALAAGETTVPDLLNDLPAELESMSVADLLRSQRRWGRTRARKFCSYLALSENRTLGRLTERQRRLLAKEVVVPTKKRRAR